MRFLPILVAVLVLSLAQPASASIQDELKQLRDMLASQQKLIDAQTQKLADQDKELQAQRQKLDTVAQQATAAQKTATASAKSTATQSARLGDKQASTTGKVDMQLAREQRKTAQATQQGEQDSTAQTSPGTSIQAPERTEDEQRPEIAAALPDAGGVLTPKGTLMYENSLDYTNTTRNLFSFNGAAISSVLLVGQIEAGAARRTVVQDSNRLRMGITNRLEADVRVPLVYRNDATSDTDTTTNTTVRRSIEGSGIGDIDMGASYQLNAGREGWPFFVANARYKTATGKGPYDIAFDSNNIAEALPTGTGYESVEGSMTVIKVTDPAVLYANVGYVNTLERSVDKVFSTTRIVKVSPGNVVNGSVGMGFSINPETSFSLGYKHNHVFPTEQRSQVTTTGLVVDSRGQSAHVGALTMGITHRFSPWASLTFSAEAGVTNDAPDARVGFRVPIRLGDLY